MAKNATSYDIHHTYLYAGPQPDSHLQVVRTEGGKLRTLKFVASLSVITCPHFLSHTKAHSLPKKVKVSRGEVLSSSMAWQNASMRGAMGTCQPFLNRILIDWNLCSLYGHLIMSSIKLWQVCLISTNWWEIQKLCQWQCQWQITFATGRWRCWRHKDVTIGIKF